MEVGRTFSDGCVAAPLLVRCLALVASVRLKSVSTSKIFSSCFLRELRALRLQQKSSTRSSGEISPEIDSRRDKSVKVHLALSLAGWTTGTPNEAFEHGPTFPAECSKWEIQVVLRKCDSLLTPMSSRKAQIHV